MTNTHHEAARDLDKEKRAYADQLLESAARWGLIRDTGKRKWSERTRSYQIIWEAVPVKLPSDWDAWRKSQDKLHPDRQKRDQHRGAPEMTRMPMLRK